MNRRVAYKVLKRAAGGAAYPRRTLDRALCATGLLGTVPPGDIPAFVEAFARYFAAATDVIFETLSAFAGQFSELTRVMTEAGAAIRAAREER